MTVRTVVFTAMSGKQYLLCVYPDGRMSVSERPHEDATWGPPAAEDRFYAGAEVRRVDDVNTGRV